MKYIETKLGTETSRPESGLQKATRALVEKILPRANPDFDRLYGLVSSWWLEIDEKTGLPQREIGRNEKGEVIVMGPLEPNLGFWTDNDVTFTPREHKAVEAQAFEAAWQTFLRRCNP